MATTTASANPPPPLPPLGITSEALNRVDLNQLSQSDLQTLSLSSTSHFDVRRTDDVVSPQLDRSVFNESAGSRRQTYSRLHHRSHSRLPGYHPSLKPHHNTNPTSDPVTHSIVHFLKHFLDGNHNPPPPPPPPPAPPSRATPEAPPGLGLEGNLKIKRKRGRKGSLMENGVGMEMGRVNGRGEVVDVEELGRTGDEVFVEELRRRTEGLETEEAVMGFLWGLEGQWCSRRKRRKYVDAGVFGDVLPMGWKLLLGLRRRDFRASVYCRRYVRECIWEQAVLLPELAPYVNEKDFRTCETSKSWGGPCEIVNNPTGRQFMSCKEVASYLKSYFGGNDADQLGDQKTCTIQQAYVLSSEINACSADKSNDVAHDRATPSTLAGNPSNDDRLMGIENLPEVKVHDIFECFKCNLTFDEKNAYLQHLFSFHQKTTKRYKFGTPVGEGVIIKADGKFECQFCHKIFDERRSYNGHVGVHVREAGKHSLELAIPVSVQENAEPPPEDASPLKSSTIDALIEITQTSIFGNSDGGTGEQVTNNQTASLPNSEEANISSGPIETKPEKSNSDKRLAEDLNNGSSEAMTENDDMVSNDCGWNVNVQVDGGCINNSEPVGSSEVQKYEDMNLDMDYGNRYLKPSNDNLEDAHGLTISEIDFQDGVSSVPMTQSFQFFPAFDSLSNKGEHEFSMVDQKLDNVTGFEEMRFDDIEPFNYGFVNGQDLPSLPGSSLNLENTNDCGIEQGFRFGSDEVMLNTMDTNQMTVCVWCRTEFKLEGVESEAPSDSIGYMCPACKAKISGHFGGGLSLDPHGF